MNAKEKKIVKLPKWALWSLTIAMLLFLFGIPIAAICVGLHFLFQRELFYMALCFLFLLGWIMILIITF